MSYLNAKPLIEGLEGGREPVLRFDVPSGLLDALENQTVDAALCPVIDFYRSRAPLVIVPSGGIGCCGPTLTVRLLGRFPFEQATVIHADSDSHTSLVLLRILMKHLYGIRPRIQVQSMGPRLPGAELEADHPYVLLIGDKVIAGSRSNQERYPHMLDLGDAWHRLTGLPFVFAIWMAREGTDLGDLPAVLSETLERNLGALEAIARRHAGPHGWPEDLAVQYLSRMLQFRIGQPQLEAIGRFAVLAHELGELDRVRPLALYGGGGDARGA